MSQLDYMSDDDFLGIANTISTCSGNRFTKDGACIVDIHSKIISTGFNSSLPLGDTAVEAAIYNSDDDLYNCTIYTTRFYPSDRELELLREEGIARVVSLAPEIDLDDEYISWVRDFFNDHAMVWTRIRGFWGR